MQLQFDARSRVTLCTGRSGTGKSTFALRYLCADRKLQCRFLFDPEGEFSARLKLPAAETVQELPLAVEDGFCIFDPHTLFPGNMTAAFEWFCTYVFETASRMPGRKVILIDEVWKYCSPNKIPFALANILQTGRKRGLESLFCSQRPNRLNEAILNEVTELVTFNLSGKNALQTVEELGADLATIETLKPGEFVSLNINSDQTLRGKLW